MQQWVFSEDKSTLILTGHLYIGKDPSGKKYRVMSVNPDLVNADIVIKTCNKEEEAKNFLVSMFNQFIKYKKKGPKKYDQPNKA